MLRSVAWALGAAAVIAACVGACGDDSNDDDDDDDDGEGEGGEGGEGASTSAGVGGQGPDDLCEGLTTDQDARPIPPAAMPALLDPFTDPSFGTTIVRISDAPAGGAIVPMYGTVPAWSSDESWLILYEVGVGHRLHDGQTYEFVRYLDLAPPDLEEIWWDPLDGDSLLLIENKSLVRYHVTADEKETLHTFSECGETPSLGDDPMYISWSGDVFGFSCDGAGFGYRLSDDTKGPLAVDAIGYASPQVSPSGAHFFIYGTIYSFDMAQGVTLDLANPAEHASIGRLDDGTDTYNAVAFDPGPSGSGVGSLVVHDMETGDSRVVIGPDTGWPYPPGTTHVSAVTLKNPGWVVVSSVGSHTGDTTLDGELYLADTNPGGAICRVAHHRSFADDGPLGYWGEPHPVMSPSGTRILFGSDWGGGSAANAYVVELPAGE
jgi:hypothetical protein